MEWLDSDEAKDLTGFGYDAMYEDLRNDDNNELFGSSEEDEGSQELSGFSRPGSIISGTSSTNRGRDAPIRPSGKMAPRKRNREERNRDLEPSQGY